MTSDQLTRSVGAATSSAAPAGDGGSPERLPFVVYVLAVGTFLMLTTEFVVAGLLPEIAGDLQVSVAQTGLLITVFAVGMTVYGGRLGDVRPYATTMVVAAATTVVLLAISLLSAYAVPTVVLVTVLGRIGLSANPVLSALAVRFAGVAPTLGVSLMVAAYNLGTAVGSWIAGLTLGSALGATGPAVVGTVIAAVTLIPAIAIAIAQCRRATRVAAVAVLA